MGQSCLLAAPGAAGRAIPVWRRRLARRRIKLQFVNDVQRFVAFFCHTIQIFYWFLNSAVRIKLLKKSCRVN
jgi:hypothetical protein